MSTAVFPDATAADEWPGLLDCLKREPLYAGKGHRYLQSGGNEQYRSYAELFACAGGIQQRLLALGLRRGDRLALIAADAASFIPCFVAGALAGMVLVPINPPPPTQKGGSYADKVQRLLQISGARALIAPAGVELPAALAGVQRLSYEALADGIAPMLPTVSAERDDVCFLQFTSGSTGDPKGVVVTHRNLAANARAIMVDGIAIRDSDVGVSWLPLFHDMGLIGKVLAPLIYPTEMVYLSTYAFIKNPNLWLDTISRYRGTISFGPNFAFALAARHFQRRPRPLDLGSLRVLGCGAEPINAEVLEDFCWTFAPHGLQPGAVMPSYGMAEATLAVAFDSPARPFRALAIDRPSYETQRRVRPALDPRSSRTLRLVGCGRSFPGHELAIVDADGTLLPERRVGEILVRGPSVATAYFDNPQASAETFIDGWLHTGDLGFFDDGELFISGRIKDLIIVNGRNHYPQDIEWTVEHLRGVRSGGVAAFSVPARDTEQIVVVAEVKRSEADTDLDEQIRRLLQTEIGVTVEHIVLVAPGQVPKSTSGKVQRRRTRQLYLQGLYQSAYADAATALAS